MKKSILTSAVSLLALTMIIFVLTLFAKTKEKTAYAPARGFKIFYLVSEVSTNNQETIKSLRIRDTESTGDWRETVYPIGGKESMEITANSSGVNIKQSNGKEFPLQGQSPSSENMNRARADTYYKTHPEFTGRTDTIAGIDVFILRATMSRGNGEKGYFERYCTPLTGTIPLKMVAYFPDGTKHKTEALKVEFK